MKLMRMAVILAAVLSLAKRLNAQMDAKFWAKIGTVAVDIVSAIWNAQKSSQQ